MNQGNKPTSNSEMGKRPAAVAYTTGSYRRAIHRVCEKVGIPKWSPNRIRHTAATEIRKNTDWKPRKPYSATATPLSPKSMLNATLPLPLPLQSNSARSCSDPRPPSLAQVLWRDDFAWSVVIASSLRR